MAEARVAVIGGSGCYAALSCVTDYDVWRELDATVSVEMILRTQESNVENARKAVAWTIGALPAERGCGCASALRDALVTALDLVPAETKRALAAIIGNASPGGDESDG